MDEAQVKALVRSVLISAGRPIDIFQLQRDFKQLEGEAIPYGNLGYHTLEAFLSSIPDTVRVHGSGSRALYSAVTSKETRHVQKLVSNTRASRYREAQRPGQAAVRKPVYDDPDEWNPPPLNQKQRKPVDYEVNDLEKFVPKETRPKPTPEEPKREMERDKEEDWNPKPKKEVTKGSKFENLKRQLREKKNRIPSSNASTSSEDYEARFNQLVDNWKPGTLSLLDVDPVFPSNCEKNMEAIKFNDGYDEFRQCLFCPIQVIEIYSPYKFWFHHDVNRVKLLQQLMTEFYSKIDPDDYQFPLERDDLCAARVEGIWKRGVVVDSTPDASDMLKIFLLDFGSVMKVHKSYVKCLLSRFTFIPRQAIRGRLARVGPKIDVWTLPSVDLLKHLVDSRTVMATSEKFDVVANCHLLTIIDTNGEEDVNVATRLVEAGLAKPAEVEGVTTIELKFPTFRALEAGNVRFP